MNSGAYDNEFQFSGDFNGQYINELYDGDYQLIDETFTDVANEYGPMLQHVVVCYRSGDVRALKSAVHKIKPLLGYVGLTTLQSACQQFENNCELDSFPSLHDDFNSLSSRLSNAKAHIENESSRLSEFVRRMG